MLTLFLLFLVASVILAIGFFFGCALTRARFDDRCASCGTLRQRIEGLRGNEPPSAEGSHERG